MRHPKKIKVDGTLYVLAEDGESTPNEDELELPETKTEKSEEASDKEDKEENPLDAMTQPCADKEREVMSPAQRTAQVVHYKGARYELVD